MIYGYGRVSTKGQAKDGNSLEAQERVLKEHGAEIIYMDSCTGTKMERPEFNKLLKKLSEGDTLVVSKLNRFVPRFAPFTEVSMLKYIIICYN